jgi:hypothetical protein
MEKDGRRVRLDMQMIKEGVRIGGGPPKFMILSYLKRSSTMSSRSGSLNAIIKQITRA